MTAFDLLSALRQRGVEITLDSGDLVVQDRAGILTEGDLRVLGDHKPELVNLLVEQDLSGAADRRGSGSVLDRIEANWKPGEPIAYRDGGTLLVAKFAGVGTGGAVNVWLHDGAVRSLPAEAIALDWLPDAAAVLEERVSIMMSVGVSEAEARVRAEACTREYLARITGGRA